MKQWAHKIGLRLSRVEYVRKAIEDKADLAEFKGRPDWKILLGMFLIAFSFAMCWPVITALGSLAIYWRRPWIVSLSVPVYITSHLVYIAGMALCGAKFSLIFFRWATRKGVEKLIGKSIAPPGMQPSRD